MVLAIKGVRKQIRYGWLILGSMLAVIGWIGPGSLIKAGQTAINKMVILTMVLEKIDRFYIEERDPNQLLARAIQGMVADLDPHSSYLESDAFNTWKRRSQGFLGIGLNYLIQPDRLIITSVLPGSPAAENGLHAGDQIFRVEGKKVEFLTPQDLDAILQNDTRMSVKLQIQRKGQTELIDLELTKRHLIPVSVAAAFMINDSTGYIKMIRFTESSVDELDAGLARLQRYGLRQLVLDLRDNPGGLFTAAIQTADRFLRSGRLIVVTRGRPAESSVQYTATPGKKYPAIPLIVLVNEASASDSEILAAALQDWDRGLILGRPTFGKGSVQTEYAFQDGSGLLLSTALYYTPLGRTIQRMKGEELFAKSYRTPKGRMIRGGGGVYPDLVVDIDQPPITEELKKILMAPDNPLLRFVEKRLPTFDQQDPLSFSRHYQIGETTVQSFYDTMKREGYSFSSREKLQNDALVRFILKREIAGSRWGEEGRAMVTAFHDKQVLKSLTLAKKAREVCTF